jgi:NAD+ diphosphatase
MLLPPSFTPLWSAPAAASSAGLWFVFRDNGLLVTTDARLPQGKPAVDVEGARCFGLLGDQPCWAGRAIDSASPPGLSFEPLRSLFDRVTNHTLALAGRAAQVIEFDRTHRFCGACAAATEDADDGRARRCPRCGLVAYPRLAPAMMVLITRRGAAGREVLLARGTRFTTPMYSALAGFVEPSETLEDCVHREVREEVGLRVRDLRYFRSQAWPFPHSLMVAFLAEYAGGELACDPREIGDAQWFPLDRLPPLPHRLSIARMLIDHAVAQAHTETP